MRESAFAREWVAEGSMTTRREDIQQVLRARLRLTSTDEIAAALELINEPERLKQLMDLALTCATIDEFRTAL